MKKVTKIIGSAALATVLITGCASDVEPPLPQINVNGCESEQAEIETLRSDLAQSNDRCVVMLRSQSRDEASELASDLNGARVFENYSKGKLENEVQEHEYRYRFKVISPAVGIDKDKLSVSRPAHISCHATQNAAYKSYVECSVTSSKQDVEMHYRHISKRLAFTTEFNGNQNPQIQNRYFELGDFSYSDDVKTRSEQKQGYELGYMVLGECSKTSCPKQTSYNSCENK